MTFLMILVVVLGTFTHDKVSGRYRTCHYLTVQGEMAITIDALKYCPLQWKFEI